MDRPILELAMAELLQKKAQVDREIAEFSAQLGKSGPRAAKAVCKRRKFTAAERQAMSERKKAAEESNQRRTAAVGYNPDGECPYCNTSTGNTRTAI